MYTSAAPRQHLWGLGFRVPLTDRQHPSGILLLAHESGDHKLKTRPALPYSMNRLVKDFGNPNSPN